MTLHITSIRRGPQPHDETGEAASAALRVYALIQSQPPAEREQMALGCIRWAEFVCSRQPEEPLLAYGRRN